MTVTSFITLRTSNPIESVFATVRHRTARTKGALSAKTAKLMVFKLVNAAAKTWRRLRGENQLPKVVQGVKFQNGIEVIKMSAHHAPGSTRSESRLIDEGQGNNLYRFGESAARCNFVAERDIEHDIMAHFFARGPDRAAP